ncbi:MAG: class I SAM-dependent methyltransferase [Acidobacteriaceae bacterium]|nr:class I SAM-dependent methyltransferase [Acidobacteriaceae bacterium]MBV9778383.1 class I SAM-dependent methyltransferase [Acidobacteriaceae bacterium]
MQSNWQVEFFRGVALESWRRAMSPEQTRAEVDFLEKTLGLGRGAHLLDVPCGNGRHALELAKSGYLMTGVDLSEEFIAEARSHCSPGVRWIQGDMRDLPWVAEFDGAYCFGNSFAYLDYAKAREFLGLIARALKAGGRFVIETGMAAESILPSLARNRWFRLGDMLMLSENRYDPAESRLDIDYTFVQNGKVETRPTASYVFTVSELCRMHAEAGLKMVELLGSVAGEKFQLGSPRLILVSEQGGAAQFPTNRGQ